MGLVFFLGFGGRSHWSTLQSGPLARAGRPEKGRKLGKELEPVVHFREWTTSWGAKAGKGPVSGGVAETPAPSRKFDKLGAPFLY